MRKIISICLLVILVIGMVYFYQPEFKYLAGRLEAHFSRVGKVSGQNVYKLNAVFHKQEHALSCEIAALKIAMAAVGSDIPESELISHLKFDPTPRQSGVWGNPFTGFVGSIDGKMFSTGYGVYWNPIAEVGLNYRRTEVVSNATVGDLIEHLLNSRPVVVWGYYGKGQRSSWKTPGGQTIDAINGEHARTVIGFTGEASNPDGIILMDPIYGELLWSTQDFMQNWQSLGNSGVVVYPNPRWVKVSGDNVVWEISKDGNSKQALAMTWDEFVSQGGKNAIAIVDPSWLNNFSVGPELKKIDA